MAREELTGDCLAWNGDTLESRELRRKVLDNEKPGICVRIDRKQSYDDDDLKVVEDHGRLKAIGKRLPLATVNAESIDLLAFRSGGAEQSGEAIEGAIPMPDGTTIWYLWMVHQRAQQIEIGALDFGGCEWGEVDFPADVEAAPALTANWDAKSSAVAP